MKKLLLVILCSILALSSYSQNIFNLFNKANSFFENFEAGKFAEAQQFFSEDTRTKVSADNLKQFWLGIQQNIGKVKSIEATGTKVQGEYYLVTVEGVFEHDKQNFSLTFNKKEELVGFFLLPKPVTYHAPAYADSTLYKEIPAYLKSDKHQLAAMITVPKNSAKFPVVVLVHGSGPNDMDETIGPNKPFKDIAAGLAVNGIASVRYVKRTVIYPQEFSGAFTVKEEVLDDALQAIALAKTIEGVDASSVYVLGHSLGGMLAPRLAALAPEIRGIIMAAAPARLLSDIIIDQNKYMVSIAKDTSAATQKQLDEAIISIEKTKLTKLKKIKPDSVMLGLPASYWVDLNNYDQVETAERLKNKRIFIIQGTLDFQVTQYDFNIWKERLADKSNVSLKLYPDLNHLFSLQFEKGTIQQYQKPANVDQRVIEDISAWIKLPE